MKKLLLVGVIFCCFIYSAILLQSTKPITASDKIILRLAESHSDEYPCYHGVQAFSAEVMEVSDGEVEVRIYDEGELGKEENIIEQIQYGGIDFAVVNVASLSESCEEVKDLLEPYLFSDQYTFNDYIEGVNGLTIDEGMKKQKILNLCWYETGALAIFDKANSWSPDQEQKGQGHKIGIPPSQVLMDHIATMGYSPVPAQGIDIYSNLDNGYLDGVFEDVITYYEERHYEQSKNAILINHIQLPYAFIASRVTMMQLTKEQQAMIYKAAQNSVKAYAEQREFKENEALAFLQGNDPNFKMRVVDYQHKFSDEVAGRNLYD